MIDQLIELYNQTPPPIRRRGRSWYPECNRQLRVVAEEHDRPLSHAAAVFAIVSPMAQVATALDWTGAILRGERTGGRFPNIQAPKIERALATRYPVLALSGPKVSAFYRAIMGDTDALVLDRWALYAAGHARARRKHWLPVGTMRAVEDAYRAAAAECNETVRAFQAMLWILVRETTPKMRGGQLIMPGYADITR